MKGLVADIQRFSVHDGPGIRTTIFFKGCPLQCAWCHNPECISFDKQILYYADKCIHCGMCDKGCYAGARVLCGREYTVEELMAEIRMDREYYGERGGVTFSGGEPLAQGDFLSEMIDACHREGIHCAVETSMIYFRKDIFRKLDLVLADLKIWEDAIHREYTGVSNAGIKENFCKLNALGVGIVARTPVITEIQQDIDKISMFLRKLENVQKYELLPYHPLGLSKAEAIGRNMRRFDKPDPEFWKEINRYAYIR